MTHIPLQRVFTTEADGPYKGITWVKRDAVVPNADGSETFRQNDVEAPDFWSDRALRTAAQKYFVRPGVTDKLPDGETSIRQMIEGVAVTITRAGLKQGVFDVGTAAVFQDDLTYLLIHQYGAFNSPVWFNCRRHEMYGIAGGPGTWAWQGEDEYGLAKTAYERPQCSACFLVPVDDTLLDEGGIADHWRSEATIFKYGSGSGTNFSKLREKGAPLSNGGKSSGLMTWLKPSDSIAGTIKSGGTTRRAARMICLDVDHPEVLDFIDLKKIEEKKAKDLMKAGWSGGMEGEAYLTVTGQNANNSVRVTDEFMRCVEQDSDWGFTSRVDGKVVRTVKAREVWRRIAIAAWECGDPGLHYDTMQQMYHTVPNRYGKITTTNPCSEFVHADNTACNLASLRVTRFLNEHGVFDVDRFKAAVRVFIIAQEILVDLSSYPTKKIAQNSHELRPLGLGYADMGTALMLLGLPYDSDDARAYAGAITSLMTGEAYKTSAELAEYLGVFEGYTVNRDEMLGVVARHRNSAFNMPSTSLSAFILGAAKDAWTRAGSHGSYYGFRNSQTTLLAPTGTIGFLMDAETTGIEPELALVKYKTMAGGGHVSLPNRMVGPVLHRLGYKGAQIRDITEYIMSSKQGVEGAPWLKEEHYSVFDCAYPAEKGTRYIAPMGHVKMMAAVQPYLSGAISKTVNLPETATVEDIENIYMQGWRLGLKAIAVFRNNSKGVQVMSTSQEPAQKKDIIGIPELLKMPMPDRIKALIQLGVLPVGHTTGGQRKLPKKRRAWRQELIVGGHKVFVSPGEYEDGSPGEIFVDMSQEGSTLRGLAAAWSIAVSVGVQHGVPWEEYFKHFINMSFDPAGAVQGHPTIKRASSVVSAVMRFIAVEYFGRTDLQNVQPELPLVEAVQAPVISGAGPLCDECGHITVRNGACHRCPNCGNSLGCS